VSVQEGGEAFSELPVGVVVISPAMPKQHEKPSKGIAKAKPIGEQIERLVR
jgi:hypothetical protein